MISRHRDLVPSHLVLMRRCVTLLVYVVHILVVYLLYLYFFASLADNLTSCNLLLLVASALVSCKKL